MSDDDALHASLGFDETCVANYDFGQTSAPVDVDIAHIGRMIGSRMVVSRPIEAAELMTIDPRRRRAGCSPQVLSDDFCRQPLSRTVNELGVLSRLRSDPTDNAEVAGSIPG